MQPIQAVIDNVREVVAAATANLTPSAEESHQSISNIAAGGFGSFPGAEAVGNRHAAVKQVFVDVTTDLLSDLEELAAGVRASMDEYENADDSSAALSQALLHVLGQASDRHTDVDIESYTENYRDELDDAPPQDVAPGQVDH